MDWPPLWPIVKLSSGPDIQLSTNISRRKAKTTSVCIEIKIGKNDTFSRLIELTNRAFLHGNPNQLHGNTKTCK